MEHYRSQKQNVQDTINRKGRTVRSTQSVTCTPGAQGRTLRSEAQLSKEHKSQEEESEVLWYQVNRL